MKSLSDTLHWSEFTLPGQFLLAGAVVMTVAMGLVGAWNAKRIEAAVVQNSAVSAALFMESFISPLSQELADTDSLSAPARQALAEIFDGTVLGERVVSYKIWLSDGRIVHSSDPTLIGKTFEPSDDLRLALAGDVASSFEDLNDTEDAAEAALGVPLLEVYSPIRQVWTGEVIAVAEFYERADLLASELRNARLTSWLVVGGAFLASGLILFGIVQAGGRTIRQQRQALHLQLEATEKISKQNATLRQRAVAASSRATAQTERAIRRIGFDLHDGPAQYLSLASLRLDSAFNDTSVASSDVSLVRGSLEKALEELRIISRGLALPDLDSLGIVALMERVIEDHKKQTDLDVTLVTPEGPEPLLNYAQKICAFRFLQEALSNVTRHAQVDSAEVKLNYDTKSVELVVSDKGQGFDTTESRPLREDGGQGLFGLKDRAESIGSILQIVSHPQQGTTLMLTLPLEEDTQ